MIRFINLSNQIIEEQKEFAFYDTVTDTFLTFNGSSTWWTVEEFRNDYTGEELDRYLKLIPDWWDVNILFKDDVIEGIKQIEYPVERTFEECPKCGHKQISLDAHPLFDNMIKMGFCEDPKCGHSWIVSMKKIQPPQ